ncbi:MAG: lamin tail domain-containing protein [Myxococcota bacterium]
MLSRLAVIGLATALLSALGSCADTASVSAPAPPEGADATPDSELATAKLAAAGDPRVLFTSPIALAKIAWTGPTTQVPTTVTTADVTLGPGAGEFELEYLLNGVAVAKTLDAAPYAFQNVPFGRQQLVVRVVDKAGAPLKNPESVSKLFVYVAKSCTKTSDCDDGHACSGIACVANECRYGPIADCCEHDLECGFSDSCVSGKCIDCLDATGCDDGNICTIDACNAGNSCIHTPIPGCCTTSANCADGLACTTDVCDLATNTCSYIDSTDPLCCNETADCEPEDPCLAYLCYRNSKTQRQYCRYGPQKVNCCTTDAQCPDSNPCTVDTCAFAGGEEAGTCAHESDPAKPDCCVVHADCDDSDPSTVDKCTSNLCGHTPDPLFCDPGPTSAIVINEIMASPGGIDDAFGEWFEVFNASEAPVNLAGWKIQTDAGEQHVITAAGAVSSSSNALVVNPGAYFVLARSADKTLNGGFTPSYRYSGITLPDPAELGAPAARTLELVNATGALIDTVTYDSASWPLVDGRSMALAHPWSDNAAASAWRAAGSSADPLRKKQYGALANKLFGTPKNGNTDISEGLADAGCVPPAGSSACAQGQCGIERRCIFPLAAGCCKKTADCNDFNACTTDACDLASSTCLPPEPVDGCCLKDSDCGDANPCNLDRCISATCRHSPDIIPGCCNGDAGCDDGDPCTIETCDVPNHACNTPEPVLLPPGAMCCATHADCDDADPATLDVCNPATHICTHPGDPEFCDSAGAACDDGNVCTTDSCNVGVKKCSHVAIAGCCNVTADCVDDGDACTQAACNSASHVCVHNPIANCCNTDAECADASPCTLDQCLSHSCHSSPIAGCCQQDSDCNDGGPCTTDTCDGGNCQHAPVPNCCTPGGDAATLTAECGSGSDGGGLCYIWSCSAGGGCEEIQHPECCTTAADCNDNSPCSIDTCQPTGICKHISTGGSGCCATDLDCLANEYCASSTCTPLLGTGQPCTGDNQCVSEACVGGVCAAPKGNGESCDSDVQCQSGHCVEGLCCDTACDGACDACHIAGSEGICGDGCALVGVVLSTVSAAFFGTDAAGVRLFFDLGSPLGGRSALGGPAPVVDLGVIHAQ